MYIPLSVLLLVRPRLLFGFVPVSPPAWVCWSLLVYCVFHINVTLTECLYSPLVICCCFCPRENYMNPSVPLSLWNIALCFAAHWISYQRAKSHSILWTDNTQPIQSTHFIYLFISFFHNAYLDGELCSPWVRWQ